MTDPRAPRRARGPSSYQPGRRRGGEGRARARDERRAAAGSIRAAVAALADAPFLTPSWFDAARAASRVAALARLDETRASPRPRPCRRRRRLPASPAAPAPAALPATLWERTDPRARRAPPSRKASSATLRAAEAHRAATRRIRDIRRGAADEQKADDPAGGGFPDLRRAFLERVRTTAAAGVDVREVARALVAHEANPGSSPPRVSTPPSARR